MDKSLVGAPYWVAADRPVIKVTSLLGSGAAWHCLRTFRPAFWLKAARLAFGPWGWFPARTTNPFCNLSQMKHRGSGENHLSLNGYGYTHASRTHRLSASPSQLVTATTESQGLRPTTDRLINITTGSVYWFRLARYQIPSLAETVLVD